MELSIGYAMKPRGLRDFRGPRKPNMDNRAQSARVPIGFQGTLKSRSPRRFHRIRYLYYTPTSYLAVLVHTSTRY